MAYRSIGDIAERQLTVRLYLEPVQAPVRAEDNATEVLGVPIYNHPDAARNAAPQWYRVLGLEHMIDCDSTTFIVAALPALCSDPKCKLDDVGFIDLPKTAEVGFVEMNWGESLLAREEQPCLCHVEPFASVVIYSKNISWPSPTARNPRRRCHGDLNVTVSHPNINDIINQCRDCVNASAVAGAIAAIAAAVGNLGPSGVTAAATATFKAALVLCLETKGITWASQVNIDITVDNIDC